MLAECDLPSGEPVSREITLRMRMPLVGYEDIDQAALE
jgi:hypothetical protein